MPLIISRNNSKNRREVLIVLGQENIDRMKDKDPFELEYWKVPWKEPLDLIAISFATDTEMIQIAQLVRQGKTDEAIKLATAGFRYRPDLGDHDLGPQTL